MLLDSNILIDSVRSEHLGEEILSHCRQRPEVPGRQS